MELRRPARPAARPRTSPRPGRVPAAVQCHPALTGIPAGSLTALAADLDIRFEARLAQRNHILRGGPRTKAVSSRIHANRRLTLTACLLALRLRDHLNLPIQVIGVLLGIDGGTVSHVTALAAGLLTAARITLTAGPPLQDPPRSPAALLQYAAAAGITLTIPENGHAMPDHFRTRRKPATRNTPGTAN